MSARAQMRLAQAVALRASERKSDASRHKCFVSYHVDDQDEVVRFLNDFGTEFIPRSVGVTDEDDFVASNDDEYIKRRIREEYLSDSTVTILLLGACTWSRRFVDWELSSSLRDDTVNKRNGLLAIPLPSMANAARLPDRVRDNWVKDNPDASYTSFCAYPSTAARLRTDIESAFAARTYKAELVNNSRSLRRANSPCA